MKRFPVLGMLLLIPAVALLLVVGCTPAPSPPAVTTPPVTPPGKPKEKAAKITTDASAIVIGSVKFAGDSDKAKPKLDDRIAKHTDKAFCGGAPGFNVDEQVWHVVDGKVGNVVIFLAPPAGKEFDPSPAVKNTFKTPREIDQPYCQYVPHVVGIYSEIQPLVFKNGAQVQHNVKINPGNPLIGSEMDQTLKPPTKGADGKLVYYMSDPRTFKAKETVIDATCSAHNWMNAKIAIFNHPYFAVTGDDGKFKIDNVPIDTEFTVYMWHETFGGLDKKKEMKKASFTKGENKSIDLEIK